MSKQTPQQFLELLRESRLLGDDVLEQVERESVGIDDAREIALRLVQSKRLTRWQSNQLLSGREGLFLPPFQLLDKLGAGGMGSVFKALWPQPNGADARIVALKVMSQDLVSDEQAARRFARETKVALQLEHPHIVRAFEANCEQFPYYLVMEYVPGRDLNAWIKRHGRLPVAWSCECVRQAALGLDYAHSLHLVHRDIKPSNLLVVTDKSGGPPHVKILDLGLARFTSEDMDMTELTKSGAVLGTVDYMAPEQTRSTKRVDIRADVYALGCTLYKLLVGEVPFNSGTAVDRLMARQMDEPPRVLAQRPDVPAALDEIVARMMARDADDRFATPAEVAEALQPFAMQAAAVPEEASVCPEQPTAELPSDADEEADSSLIEFESALSNGAGVPLDPTLSTTPKAVVRAGSLTRSVWMLASVGVGLVALLLMVTLNLQSPEQTAMVAAVPKNSPDRAKPPPVRAKPPPDPAQPPPPRIEPSRAAETQTEWARRLELPVQQTVASISLDLRLIPPGEFTMGTGESRRAGLQTRADALDEEHNWYLGVLFSEFPAHPVRISRPFWLGKHEVTQRQFRAVMGDDVQFNNAGDNHPADQVTWYQAIEFCNRLSVRERLAPYYEVDGADVTILGGEGYRLPTEAEWEYACRAGNNEFWYFGDNGSDITRYGWAAPEAEGTIHPVGQKQPNPFGLHDMLGNTWEWTFDWFGGNYYREEHAADPTGPATGEDRVLRGGGFAQPAEIVRCATRVAYGPGQATVYSDCGFRVARTIARGK